MTNNNLISTASQLRERSRCLDAALRYCRRGWSVVPLHGIRQNGLCTCGNATCSAPGKHPIGKWKHLQEYRMTEEEITTFYARRPWANVGIVTGAISGGLIVLDADGDAARYELTERAIDLGSGPTVITGRGYHYYLHGGERQLGNFSGSLPNVDGRADGGYVVAPPSMHVSGKRYEFAANSEMLPLPTASRVVLELFDSAKQGKNKRSDPSSSNGSRHGTTGNFFGPGAFVGGRERAYALQVLGSECLAVRSASFGQQEHVLNAAALKVGHHLSAGAIDLRTAREALVEAGLSMACQPGRAAWDRRTIEDKVQRALHDGASHPFDYASVNWRDTGTSSSTDETDRTPSKATSVSSVSPLAWERLEELPPLRKDVPALDASLLPDGLRAWIVDRADLLQVPLEFVVMPALAALGMTLGRRLGVFPKAKPKWLVIPNLWCVIIGAPGSKKTSALSTGTSLLKVVEHEERAEYDKAIEKWTKEKDEKEVRLAALGETIAALQRESLQRELDEQELVEQSEVMSERERIIEEIKLTEPRVPRRYYTSDGTAEKVAELLSKHPLGIANIQDELSSWFASLGKKGREGERQFYLTGWAGTESFISDRIMRGTTAVEAVCLSVIGGIQSDVFEHQLVNHALDGSSGDGLLQRFQLMVWPEPLRHYRNVDRLEDDEASEQALEVFRFAARLDPRSISFCGRVDFDDRQNAGLRLTDEAQDFFDEWHVTLNRRIRSPEYEKQPGFASHLAKFDKLFASLALLDYVSDLAGSLLPQGPYFAPSAKAISLKSVVRAAHLCAFLEAHALKVYASEVDPSVAPAHALAAKIRDGSVFEGMTVREIDRSGWSGLKNAKLVEAGLALLKELRWVRVETVRPATGRPTRVVRLSPYLKGALA